jgi:hypothetical protein
MAKKKSRKPFRIVNHGNVKVPIYKREPRAESKSKAGAIADAIVAGDPATIKIDDLRLEIRRARSP